MQMCMMCERGMHDYLKGKDIDLRANHKKKMT